MDDHAALVERLEGYTGYADADTRALDEERVRAFVGERLALARERLGKELDEATTRRLEAAIYECQFANMLSVRQLLDARLDDPTRIALEHADRGMVTAGERIAAVPAGELGALLDEIEAAFKARRVAIEAKAAVRASD